MRAVFRSDRVQLVGGDDAGMGVACMLEYMMDVRFQLSNVWVQQLGAFGRKKFSEHKVVTTLASRVLPVPGGP